MTGDVFNVPGVNDVQYEQIEEFFRGQANSWHGGDRVARYLSELFANPASHPSAQLRRLHPRAADTTLQIKLESLQLGNPMVSGLAARSAELLILIFS
ncbi:hypothetical protein HDG32_004331 [Paraburkholderia sp. CI2]|uniref:hypothetical protein n=1 Tax=unclassified Paraburkholderia TaxID=2615204 RepID=UPI00160CE790|nr:MULTISPECIES: hypothetical protein [unclassified Paraburkholderia]MBB5468206.1 hypothetical protein [Paraburkholderia sp. CI2]MBC8742903.1 hypothetical protein [Paraburkholderia sp. UCT31]